MEFPIRRWTMVVDLDLCTGCSACVIACHAENNLPIVSEREVVR
ncbi:MAG: 4Fe-4S binding protein, partial [Anaerolineae bacterium]